QPPEDLAAAGGEQTVVGFAVAVEVTRLQGNTLQVFVRVKEALLLSGQRQHKVVRTEHTHTFNLQITGITRVEDVQTTVGDGVVQRLIQYHRYQGLLDAVVALGHKHIVR